jgi:lipopolysaccharide/colanic/teichoic acid biosynthesis glycosyltransferase
MLLWHIRCEKFGFTRVVPSGASGAQWQPFEMIKFRSMKDAVDAQGIPYPIVSV